MLDIVCLIFYLSVDCDGVFHSFMEHSCKWWPCLVNPTLGLSQGLSPCRCVTFLPTQSLNTFGNYCLAMRLWILGVAPAYLDRCRRHTCGWQKCRSQLRPLPLCLRLVPSGSIQSVSVCSCFGGEDWFVSLSALEIEPWKPSAPCGCVHHPEGQRGEVVMSSEAAHPRPLYGTGQLSLPPSALALCRWPPQAARWHFECSVWRLLQ